MDDIAILIPAYEPDGKLAALVDDLRPLFRHLVLVDDGSTRGRDVLDAARGRVDALLAHAANRGKGWKRYAQGARKDLAAEVRREEEEASEARAEFKRTETSVGETVRKLLEEMRKFNADYNRATSRMNVRSDNGGASQ